MFYGEIKSCDVADGPGVRVSLFVSGCRHCCKGCFNEQTWDFQYGFPYTEETQESILQMLEPSYIQGLTLLGGEPLEPENQPCVLQLIQAVRERFQDTKDIWCYTGCVLEKIQGTAYDTPSLVPILEQIDVLVDGPFIEQQRNLQLRFRGSENQRIITNPMEKLR